MLSLALRTTGYEVKDPLSANLHFSINADSVVQVSNTKLLQHVQLLYQVKWPLTIFLNETTMQKYNQLFLFFMKFRQLSFVLRSLRPSMRSAKPKKSFNFDLCRYFFYSTYKNCRYQMQQFVTAFQDYIIQQVHQIGWKLFVEKLEEVESVEQLIQEHHNYLDAMLDKCLISKSETPVTKLLETMFDYIFKFRTEMQKTEPDVKNCKIIFASFQKCSVFLGSILRSMTSKIKNDHIEALLLSWDFNHYFRRTK